MNVCCVELYCVRLKFVLFQFWICVAFVCDLENWLVLTFFYSSSPLSTTTGHWMQIHARLFTCACLCVHSLIHSLVEIYCQLRRCCCCYRSRPWPPPSSSSCLRSSSHSHTHTLRFQFIPFKFLSMLIVLIQIQNIKSIHDSPQKWIVFNSLVSLARAKTHKKNIPFSSSIFFIGAQNYF